MVSMARLHRDGKGVPQDYEQAAKLYRQVTTGASRSRCPLLKCVALTPLIWSGKLQRKETL
jgi:hypothetical protein